MSLRIGIGVSVLGTALGLWLALAQEGRDRLGLGALVDMIDDAQRRVAIGTRHLRQLLWGAGCER